MKSYVDSVYCEFKYSGVGSGLLAGAAIATLALIVATPFTPFLQAFLGLYVIAFVCHASRAMSSVRAIRIDGEHAIIVEERGGFRTGVVRDGSFVAPWLTIVRWRPEGAWLDRTVPILPGMMREDEFRRLRILLRWL
jgi:hypothetical protein